MTEKIQKINNPLTIIAIFAALAEINGTIAIGLIDKELHYIFIWFVIGFPTLLVILFFVTLNYNTKVMYSPSDYKDDKNFIDSLYGNPKNIFTEKIDTKFILKEIERKINLKVDDSINSIQISDPKLESEFKEIKTQLKKITHQTINEIKVESNSFLELENILLKFNRWPAYYNLIYVILKTNAKSLKDINNNLDKYYVPIGWDENGINKLFSTKILLKTKNDNFEINPKYNKYLRAWFDKNYEILEKINDLYVFSKNEVLDEDKTKTFRKKLFNLRDQLII